MARVTQRIGPKFLDKALLHFEKIYIHLPPPTYTHKNMGEIVGHTGYNNLFSSYLELAIKK